jgi:pyruvate dehydrogenase E2 component (dihydrolipoamide acetyltransferase)
MPPDILMPALSPTMEEGKLAKWHVKEGDSVKPGDILAEIETDKATMEFEAIDEGKIEKLLVPEGTEGVKINAPIARLLTDQDDAAKPSRPKQVTRAAAEAPAAPPPPKDTMRADPPKSAVKTGNGSTHPQPEDRIFASPLAKRIARDSGIQLNGVHGTGPRGRIVKADVEAALKIAAPAAAETAQQPARAAPVSAPPVTKPAGIPAALSPLPDSTLFFKPGEYESAPNDSMRKAIARRLTSAKALIPHYYLTIECDIAALIQARARLNDRSPKGDGAYKLSVNDFVVKATAQALMKHPEVNASWTDAAILRHGHANIGIAVDLNPGLITPILFRAESKGLVEISNEVKQLAERAKGKKLQPQDYEGGSFSISNLGMFGIKEFTAIINPPQSAILAVGAAEERVIAREGKITTGMMMTLTMSCDHRVMDGATGARFMQTLRVFLEEPASMLL